MSMGPCAISSSWSIGCLISALSGGGSLPTCAKEIDEEFATGGHGAWAPKKKEESEDKKQARIDRIERNKYRGLQSRAEV